MIPALALTWEPGKFIAALQNDSASGRPVFLKVNYDNGHFTEEKLVTFDNFASQGCVPPLADGAQGFSAGELEGF